MSRLPPSLAFLFPPPLFVRSCRGGGEVGKKLLWLYLLLFLLSSARRSFLAAAINSSGEREKEGTDGRRSCRLSPSLRRRELLGCELLVGPLRSVSALAPSASFVRRCMSGGREEGSQTPPPRKYILQIQSFSFPRPSPLLFHRLGKKGKLPPSAPFPSPPPLPLLLLHSITLRLQ